MKKIIIPVAAIVLCAWIPAAASYLSINALLDSLHGALGDRPAYAVESSDNSIVLTDVASGMAACTIRQSDAKTVTMSATIARLPLGSQKQVQRAIDQIVDFNVNSSVGTLSLNNRTGEVRMEHYVNSSLVPSSSVAQVAIRFADVARTESGLFSRAM